jgi:hypothetical protein
MLDTQQTVITSYGAGPTAGRSTAPMPRRPGRAVQPIARHEVIRRQESHSEFYAERASGWGGLLSTTFSSIASEAAYDLRTRIQNVSRDAHDYIEDTDPGRTGADLKAWLDERLVVELAHHQLGVTGAVRSFSGRAAQYFALPGSVTVDPPRTRTHSDFDTARLAVHRKRNSTLSTTVNILMRAYMGFMIFFVLTKVMEVAIPGFLGALPVLLMGGVALYEEYRKRIEQRQHQASEAVAQHIGEFADRASHEMEDLIRGLEISVDAAYRSRVEPLLTPN